MRFDYTQFKQPLIPALGLRAGFRVSGLWGLRSRLKEVWGLGVVWFFDEPCQALNRYSRVSGLRLQGFGVRGALELRVGSEDA